MPIFRRKLVKIAENSDHNIASITLTAGPKDWRRGRHELHRQLRTRASRLQGQDRRARHKFKKIYFTCIYF
jgi:hypothetical protein